MRHIHLLALSLLLAALLAPPAHADCLLTRQAAASLDRWKADGFAIASDADRHARAMALLECLGERDPFIRDGIAFAALSTWMRTNRLDALALQALERKLLVQLDGHDPAGFRKPFAALALSEVARTDRIRPWMVPEQRVRMTDAAATYLRSVRDYRGHVDGEGWRHGVAHGADWVMQLALNPALPPEQAKILLDAIGTQVMPVGDHAYAFGEPARLARAAVYLIKRGQPSPERLFEWLGNMVKTLGPRPVGKLQSAWWTRRSNLENFLNATGNASANTSDPALIGLSAAIRKTLANLP